MKKGRIIKLALLAGLFVAIIVSLIFVSTERKKMICKSVEISFDDEEQFITESEVLKLITKNFANVNGALIDTINSNVVEEIIEEIPWVNNAEVFKGYSLSDSLFFNGALKIRIKQEKPVLRIVDGANGYYMTEGGKHLPFSVINSVNVVVVTGNTPDSIVLEQVLPVVAFMNEHVFWNAQIQQIHVKSNGELLLIPRAGNHQIEFGKSDRIEVKFRNLLAVYKEGFKYNHGWNKYKSISLKFDNQVVCTRR